MLECVAGGYHYGNPESYEEKDMLYPSIKTG